MLHTLILSANTLKAMQEEYQKHITKKKTEIQALQEERDAIIKSRLQLFEQNLSLFIL